MMVDRDQTRPNKCGHTARGFSGEAFTCDLPNTHHGLHAQRDHVRDRVEVTTWGDDGLASHATSDLLRLYGQHGGFNSEFVSR
jgi:hypothetical protein